MYCIYLHFEAKHNKPEMDSLNVVLANACTSTIFSMVDIATLMCVSKEVNNLVISNKLHWDSNSNVIMATALHIGCTNTEYLIQEHCVNVPILFRIILQVNRLYGNTKRNKDLLDVLEMLTSQLSKKIIKMDHDTCIKKQQATIGCLAHLIHKDCVHHNVIILYVLMNFVKRVANVAYPKRRSTTSILSESKFRRTVYNKCTDSIRSIRDEITCFPFGFLEKVYRQCTDTRRVVSFYDNM